jgi:hypothetical protein
MAGERGRLAVRHHLPARNRPECVYHGALERRAPVEIERDVREIVPSPREERSEPLTKRMSLTRLRRSRKLVPEERPVGEQKLADAPTLGRVGVTLDYGVWNGGGSCPPRPGA